MTPTLFLQIAIRPALSLLPPSMNMPAAEAMLVAIALQESRCCHRRQIGGPARSLFQFEVGGVRGVVTHKASAPHLAAVLEALAYAGPDATAVYVAIEHNDVLAAVCARLLLWTLPGPLADRHDPETAWQQYLDAWRPGKPRRESWDGYYAAAWDTVA